MWWLTWCSSLTGVRWKRWHISGRKDRYRWSWWWWRSWWSWAGISQLFLEQTNHQPKPQQRGNSNTSSNFSFKIPKELHLMEHHIFISVEPGHFSSWWWWWWLFSTATKGFLYFWINLMASTFNSNESLSSRSFFQFPQYFLIILWILLLFKFFPENWKIILVLAEYLFSVI